MPPAQSDDESSAAEIPYSKAKGRGKGKAKAEDTDNGDEDVEADEFVVEKITSHRFEPKGILKLEVKWQGFPASDNTWEPEENLDGCPEDVAEYFKSIGGRPSFKDVKSKDTPTSSKAPSKKRKISEGPAPAPDSARSKGRPKKAKQDEDESTVAPAESEKWEPPKGTWENDVVSIDTMEKDDEGNISAYVMWQNGRRSFHAAKVVNQKCPQKMLIFYEAHLQFNAPGPASYNQQEPETSNGTDSKNEVDEDEEAGIKPVASEYRTKS